MTLEEASSRAGNGVPAELAAFASILPEPTLVLTPQGTVRMANPAAAALLGRRAHDLRERSLSDFTVEDAARVARYLAICARNREMVPGALTLVTADGTQVPCRTDGVLVALPVPGRPPLLLLRAQPRAASVSRFVALAERIDALNREVARRQEAERVLRQQAELLDQTRDAIFAWELDTGAITYINRAAEELYRCSRADVMGVPIANLLRTRAALPFEEVERMVRHSGSWSGELVHETPDGRRLIVESRMVLLPIPGAVPLVLETTRDVTEARKERAQVEAAQRLEAVGRLAGGVAHEINNALQGAIGFSSFALKRLPEGSEARSDIEQVLLASQRAASITRGLLAFSRRQVLQPASVDLGEVVEGFASMLRQAIGRGRSLRIDRPGEPVVVQADRGQLEQVLLNLAINAGDATPPGGVVTVRLGRSTLTAEDLSRMGRPDLPPGSYACYEVQDTGHGMDESTLTRIFEPFFTTKPPGQGTGLGLSVVHGIVHQSGGAITVRSALDSGATFTVYLPQAHDPAAEEGAAPEQARGGAERILLVDDDPVVLRFAAELLRSAGYTVYAAADGEEALGRVQELAQTGPSGTRRPVDLVVTDLIMPKLGGRDLALELERRYPGVPVLYTSGHPGEEPGARGVLNESAPFVQKPFTGDELLLRVREVLEG